MDRLQSASVSEELKASISRVVKVESCKAWDYAENVVSKLLQNFSSLAIKADNGKVCWKSVLEAPKLGANLQLGIPVEMDVRELAALHNAHLGNITTFNLFQIL